MKKGLFGYNVSEVDVVLGALREENESLNASIATLKTQIKNSTTSIGAKANLLENDIKKNEEIIKSISEEKDNLVNQVTTLTKESEDLKQQNEELKTQVEQLHMQIEDLTIQIAESQVQIVELTAQSKNIDTSIIDELQSQLNTEKESKASLEQTLIIKSDEIVAITKDLEETKSILDIYAKDGEHEKALMKTTIDDYERLKEELKSTKTALGIVTNELDNLKSLMEEKELKADLTFIELESLKAELEIAYTKNSEQADELAAAKALNEEQAKLQTTEKKQMADLTQASEISFQAYYDMSKMRNEVVEYMHDQMKEYYQIVNENSVKMHNAIEQRQLEYNQMIRDFFTQASKFRVSMSNVDEEYNNMTDFNISIDKISNRMNEIMEDFIEETSTSLKKKEESLKQEVQPPLEAVTLRVSEEVIKKPIVFKIPG